VWQGRSNLGDAPQSNPPDGAESSGGVKITAADNRNAIQSDYTRTAGDNGQILPVFRVTASGGVCRRADNLFAPRSGPAGSAFNWFTFKAFSRDAEFQLISEWPERSRDRLM
jgi:hypothetical protein